jgi:hypothetical protein
VEIIRAESIQQFSFGYKLLIPFTDLRHNSAVAPVNSVGETFEVVVIKPDGSSLTKTASLEFPDDAVAEIAFPVEALNFDIGGTYYYQVIRTTGGAEVRSPVGNFEVIESLPSGLPLSPPTSPLEGFFPIYDSLGGLDTSGLEDRSGVLYYNDVPLASSGVEIVGEIPNGAVNGVNATFTTDFTFVPESVEIFLNGIRQALVDDYTLSGGNTITFLVSPESGSHIFVNYTKS